MKSSFILMNVIIPGDNILQTSLVQPRIYSITASPLLALLMVNL